MTPQDRHLAELAMQLLAKAALTGQEVPAFVAVHNWLQGIRDAEPEPEARPEPVGQPGP